MELRPADDGKSLVWTPTVGEWTNRFIESKANDPSMTLDSMQRVAGEALEILSRCVAPASSPRHDAGLVVGQVQSGKTLSFTTVISLARDNGYGLVVVLTGRTIDLQDQSEGRLEKDLGLGHFEGPWLAMSSPNSSNDGQEFRSKILQWKSSASVRRRLPHRPVLVTLMKHQDHIDKFADLIRESDLDGVPTLIIDDESDQAGPNTKTSRNLRNSTNDESVIYKSLGVLRSKIPHHTLLQYTATPQANLLAGSFDALNPTFARVLTPGDEYVGGKYFFQTYVNKHIMIVPQGDICDHRALPATAPNSLQSALRVYLLGAAYSLGRGDLSTRSMLVQVHQNKAPHSHYAQLIDDLLEGWFKILNRHGSESRRALFALFESDYVELSRTVDDLPSLDKLLDLVLEVMENKRTVVLNSESDQSKVKWDVRPFWILVGGLKLDRGFTVKGLTVTYMPRKVAQYADVLQQRARFFGYRLDHIDLCRIYLPVGIKQAFCDYVENEEHMRLQLTEHADDLAEWRRAFLLSQAQLGLTRPGVIGRPISRVRGHGWLWPRRAASDPEIIHHNNSLIDNFVFGLRDSMVAFDANTYPEFADTRSRQGRNTLYKDVDLNSILELLDQLQAATDQDAATFSRISAALRQAQSLATQPRVTVFLVNDYGVAGQRGRSQDRLAKNIFVGRSGRSAGEQTTSDYVGDEALRFPDDISVHFRKIVVTDAADLVGCTKTSVSWIAVHCGNEIQLSSAILEVRGA